MVSSGDQITVTWQEPRVTNNSDGNNVKVTANRKSGESFKIGEHLVRYEIADRFGNKDVCQFLVIVKRKYTYKCAYIGSKLDF